MMYEANLDIKMIKEIGGWKTNPMFDRYCHVTRDKKRRAMLEFESYLQPNMDAKWTQSELHSHKPLLGP